MKICTQITAKIFLLLALAIAAYSAPIQNYPGPLPNLLRDGQRFTSSAIGQNVSGPGTYLWFVEDLILPGGDRDYNDIYGTVTILDNENRYHMQTLGGLSDYYRAGRLGFSGSTYDNGVFRLIWESPLGRYYSGTDQVAIFRIPAGPSPVPEPRSMALAAVGVGALLLRRHRAVSRRRTRLSGPCDLRFSKRSFASYCFLWRFE